MTKYILHGGNLHGAVDKGASFFREMLNGLGEQSKLLMCFFAQPQESWQKKYDEWAGHITEAASPAKPHIEIALPDIFREQATPADALFLYGGDCRLLMKMAQSTPGFIDALTALPVIAGASAGTVVLTGKHWCCDYRKVHEGLGIVPVNCIVHYKSSWYADNSPLGPIDWDEADRLLQARVGKEGAIIKIAEGDFVIIEQ